LTIRTLSLPALIVVGVLLACEAVLLALSEKKAQAAFPGKNGGIAYNSNGVIYTINPGGGGKTKVTRDGDEPSYSPNGKRIAYSESDGHDYEIYTINAGGGGKVQLTNNNTEDQEPSYSPDGKKIVYSGNDGNESELYTINSGGGGKFKVADNGTGDYDPSWGSRP
jgi:Tol biopolymer transport system component